MPRLGFQHDQLSQPAFQTNSHQGFVFMDNTAWEFFQNITQAPGPSGFEQPIQREVREWASEFADTVTTDVHGNVIACVNPDADARVLLAGHCDQIGFLVQHIDKDGFLWVLPIGGWDPLILLGQKVTVWTASGPRPGVIGRKPIHLLTTEERGQSPKLKDLWVDVGALNDEDAKETIQVGDPVTLELGFREFPNELISGPCMDNRCGLWVAFETLRRVKEKSPNCAVYAVSTVQEEIGLRGAQTSAHEIDPHVGVAIDVTHSTDCPTIDMRQQGDLRLGKGPVVFRGPNMNPKVVEGLIQTAEDKEIPFQRAALGKAAPNDANALQTTRSGVATGLIGIPL
ncbi:MAG: M42 family metallopeptidase, partial [Planctomycetales bacterium]